MLGTATDKMNQLGHTTTISCPMLTLAPIWLPHWPAWMWTISLMVAGFSRPNPSKAAAWTGCGPSDARVFYSQAAGSAHHACKLSFFAWCSLALGGVVVEAFDVQRGTASHGLMWWGCSTLSNNTSLLIYTGLIHVSCSGNVSDSFH